MPSLSRTMYDLRQVANDQPQNYRSEAGKLLAPKIDGEKNPLHDRIIRQVEQEYQECWLYNKPKLKKNMKRLKLYNNQLKDEAAVGDPLLFTVHQTVLAALYYDHLQVEFEPREEGDEDAAQNMNSLSEFDYGEMGKAEHDYEWDWDALAFGRGLSLFNDFDSDSKTPIPETIDSLTFLRDPKAKSVHGSRSGSGALRYGYREVFKTKWDMEDNPEYFNLGKLRKTSKSDYDSPSYEAKKERDKAQGRTDTADDNYGDNAEYCLMQGFTYIDGKKYLVEEGNNRTVVVRLTPLQKYWPLNDRPAYPMAYDWDGVSVFDIIEDKQRFRAELLNVSGQLAKAALWPMYLLNTNANIIDRDLSFGFNKFIRVGGPVGENVIHPLQKSVQGIQEAKFVLDFLDLSVQRAMATPEIQMGTPSQDKRTLGEQQLVSTKVDTRYSLTARIWGWSERRFWEQWYRIYERDFESGIHKKALRLTGPFGPKFRNVGRDDIIAKSPLGLDIKIESREISEAKKQRNFQQLGIYLASAFSDPSADRLYSLRKMGKYIMPKEEVERMLPLTIDERRARQENDDLSDNKIVIPNVEDDHNVHLRMHIAAKDTPALEAHIKAHEEALMFKRIAPQAFPVLPQDMQNGQPTPMANTAPAMANSMTTKPAETAMSGNNNMPMK